MSQALARHGRHHSRGVHGGLVGQEVTLDLVGGPDQVGHVELAGERWRAISGGDGPSAGTKVLVTGVQGTTLIVWPADGHLPSTGLGERTMVRSLEKQEWRSMIAAISSRRRRPRHRR